MDGVDRLPDNVADGVGRTTSSAVGFDVRVLLRSALSKPMVVKGTAFLGSTKIPGSSGKQTPSSARHKVPLQQVPHTQQNVP